MNYAELWVQPPVCKRRFLVDQMLRLILQMRRAARLDIIESDVVCMCAGQGNIVEIKTDLQRMSVLSARSGGRKCFARLLAVVVLLPSLLLADNEKLPPPVADAVPPGIELTRPQTYRLRVILRVTAESTPLRDIVATGPIPVDWPEQKVRLISETKAVGVTTQVVTFAGQAALLQMRVATLAAGGDVEVVRVYELTRSSVRFIGDDERLRVPEKPSKQLRLFMGEAPGIEVRHPDIVQLAKTLAPADAIASTKVRAYFDWVTKTITYETGAYQGAAKTLTRKTGDCDNRSALFIALCRASGIPARTVWIEGHAYAEFYLEESADRGYWIPAELAGPDWLGRTTLDGPILQKGDRFYNSLTKTYEHFVPQTVRAINGTVQFSCTRTREADSK